MSGSEKKDIVAVAMQYLGVPAKLHRHRPEQRPFPVCPSNDPAYAFDCSGFVQHVLRACGIALPENPYTAMPVRHCTEFFRYLGRTVPMEERLPGDVLLWSWRGISAGHSSIYIGRNNGEECVVHTSLKNKCVAVHTLDECLDAYGHTLQAPSHMRQLQRFFSNPIAVKRVLP